MENTAKEFAKILKKISTESNSSIADMQNLLWRTIWTLGKYYDDEEEMEIIERDTLDFMKWEADYMDND